MIPKDLCLKGDCSLVLAEPLAMEVKEGVCANLTIDIPSIQPLNVILHSAATLRAHVKHLASSSVESVFILKDGAKLELTESFIDGSSSQRSRIELQGNGASVKIAQVIFGKENDVIDVHTITDHQVPDTHSRVDIRVLAHHSSQITAIGDIHIGGFAKNSVAHLTDHALILSKDARAHAIPAMEVIANDVIASHAASTDRISSEQLFYLEQRGIAKDDARRLIAMGFARSILDQYKDVVMDRLEKQWDKLRLRK